MTGHPRAAHLPDPLLFLASTVAFNLVGVVDLVGDYSLATLANFGAAGEFGFTYAIPIIYVPLP